jgi:ribosomal protein S12 methylthiotransferase accessory factor
MTRAQSRFKSAQYLNGLSRDELFERFIVTRIAKIDGLDCIGVPVYSAIRPASQSISVNSGKSQCPVLARAGAIAEAIEFHTFEQCPKDLPVEVLGNKLDLPFAKNAEYGDDTVIPIELVVHHTTKSVVRFPAEIVWLTRRHKDRYFMRSSTGQSVAATFDDAFLTGLYEVVERDQTTLCRTSIRNLGIYPPRVSVPAVHQTVSPILEKLAKASLKLYLFYCTVDLGIPVYWAILIDPYCGSGAYFGYGCHCTHALAVERAILEAIQGRGVFISGARDDILRRDFDNCRAKDPKELMAEMEQGPVFECPRDLGKTEFTVEEELSFVLDRLKNWQDNIYYKAINLGDLWAVKTIVLGLECPDLIEAEIWRSVRWEKLHERSSLAPVCTA